MDVTATVAAPCGPAELFSWVEDLSRYPDWHQIVVRAEPSEAADGDPGPAHIVDLEGRLGPFRRSKRLRMVRSIHDSPSRVRFERREVDGRRHAPWVLDAEVAPTTEGATLAMKLHYGGSLWLPPVDRLLAAEIERSRQRLLALVANR